MGLKLLVPAIGVLLALAARRCACFVRAFAITYLGRPRTAAAAQRRSRSLVVGSDAHLRHPCLLAGLFPGIVIDWLQPAAACSSPVTCIQATIPWLSIIPVSAGRSSYNGLLLFGFLVAAASLAAVLVHRLASRAVRTAPFWIAATQTLASSRNIPHQPAQPIRSCLQRSHLRHTSRSTCRRPEIRGRQGCRDSCAIRFGTSRTRRLPVLSGQRRRCSITSSFSRSVAISVSSSSLWSSSWCPRAMGMISALATQLGQMVLVLALAPAVTG